MIGFLEPLEEEYTSKGIDFEFDSRVIGTNIPPEFIPSCEKGAKTACEKGVLAGYPLSGVLMDILYIHKNIYIPQYLISVKTSQ